MRTRERGTHHRKGLFHAFSVQKRINIGGEPGEFFILKDAVENGSPFLRFVAPYGLLEYSHEVLKDWGSSSIRCAELLPQEVWPCALFDEESLECRDT